MTADLAHARFPRAAGSPPPAGDAAPRPAAPRDDLVARLGPRFRGATLRLEFELRTAAARQVFVRDFVHVSHQLHALESSRRVQGIDHALLNDALGAIARRADAVRATLMLAAADARALIALHGHVAADIGFARPTPLRATIVSPHARDFLDLITETDDALVQLEKAWLLGLLEPVAKARRATECRNALRGFKHAVREQRHAVGEHVRQVNAARRAPARGLASPPPVAPIAAGTTRPHAAREPSRGEAPELTAPPCDRGQPPAGPSSPPGPQPSSSSRSEQGLMAEPPLATHDPAAARRARPEPACPSAWLPRASAEAGASAKPWPSSLATDRASA